MFECLYRPCWWWTWSSLGINAESASQSTLPGHRWLDHLNGALYDRTEIHPEIFALAYLHKEAYRNHLTNGLIQTLESVLSAGLDEDQKIP